VACTKTGSKNDLFLNCQRKPKELSKKELSNVAPASLLSGSLRHLISFVYFNLRLIINVYLRVFFHLGSGKVLNTRSETF
jgi:hypothetical protein